MQTHCLKDFIGIRGCGNAEPASGLFINTLPGLPLESIAKFANADQVTYATVWSDIQDRALPKFTTAVANLLKKKYKLKTVRNTVDMLRRKNLDNITAASAQFRGFTTELSFPQDPYVVASNYQVQAIETISIYLSAVTTNPIAVKIIDLDTDEILESLSLLVADQIVGWNTLQVNKYYKANRLFIGYNATEVNSPETEITFGTRSNFGSCVRNIYPYGCNAQMLGATATLDSNPIVTSSGYNSYGLSAIISVQCNYDFLICNHRQLFATALQYYLGAELMIERQHTSRINQWTTVDRDLAKELESRFLDESENQLNLIIEGIDLDLYDCCFECNARVTIKEARM